MAVGVGGGELQTGWDNWTFGTLVLACGQARSKAGDVGHSCCLHILCIATTQPACITNLQLFSLWFLSICHTA